MQAVQRPTLASRVHNDHHPRVRTQSPAGDDACAAGQGQGHDRQQDLKGGFHVADSHPRQAVVPTMFTDRSYHILRFAHAWKALKSHHRLQARDAKAENWRHGSETLLGRPGRVCRNSPRAISAMSKLSAFLKSKDMAKFNCSEHKSKAG